MFFYIMWTAGCVFLTRLCQDELWEEGKPVVEVIFSVEGSADVQTLCHNALPEYHQIRDAMKMS